MRAKESKMKKVDYVVVSVLYAGNGEWADPTVVTVVPTLKEAEGYVSLSSASKRYGFVKVPVTE